MDIFKEHDVIVVTTDVSEEEYEAKAGAIGAIVHMYSNVDAFIVEFNYGDVYRCDLITVWPHQARLALEEDFERERRERTAEVSGD